MEKHIWFHHFTCCRYCYEQLYVVLFPIAGRNNSIALFPFISPQNFHQSSFGQGNLSLISVYKEQRMYSSQRSLHNLGSLNHFTMLSYMAHLCKSMVTGLIMLQYMSLRIQYICCRKPLRLTVSIMMVGLTPFKNSTYLLIKSSIVILLSGFSSSWAH